MHVTKPRLFFDYALRNRFAFPSFNVCNLELARAVIVAAESEGAPVMLQSYFGDLHYGGLDVLPQLLRILAEQASVPVLVHQDHPDNDRMILQTLRRGYYSVMYDGGHLPLEENIRGAAYIAEIAHAMGAVVETELGLFGGGENHPGRAEKATAEGSRRMVEETGIDTLAPSVGSLHGQSSRCDLALLEDIAGVTPAPLVLHGGSGIHPDDLPEALQMNVVKVNIGADVFRAWMRGLKEGALLEDGDAPRTTSRCGTPARRSAKLPELSCPLWARPLTQSPCSERWSKRVRTCRRVRARSCPFKLGRDQAKPGAPAATLAEQKVKTSTTLINR